MPSLRKRGKTWYYRIYDANGAQHEVKGCTDRRETERMAAAAEMEAAKVRAGMIDPKAIGFRDHEARPLAEHLADWHAYLIGKGSTPKHADLTRNRVARVIELAKARRISELTPSRVQAALKAIRDTGISLRSVHHYTRVTTGFSRWLWRDGRAREHTLAHLTPPNPDPDRRHERRALTPDEAAQLIQAAERGPVVFKLTGPDRAALYRLALGTGFRAAELRSLRPEAIDLDGKPPTVAVNAAYSKRRRDDVQPIRPDLAEALRPWLAAKAPGRPIFGDLTKHTAEMMRHDLEASGVPYVDASGRVADFHSLRHTYISALARTSAPVKVVQTLARHSTPSLTFGVYAHIGLFDQSAALDGLPDLAPSAPASEPEAMAATGTDGQPISKLLALTLPLSGDGSGRNLSVTGGDEHPNERTSVVPLMPHNPLLEGALDDSCRPLSDPDERRGWDSNPRYGMTIQRFSRPSTPDTKPQSTQGVYVASTDALPFSCPCDPSELSPDLALVVDAWPSLPEAIRQAILMMVKAAKPLVGGGAS